MGSQAIASEEPGTANVNCTLGSLMLAAATAIAARAAGAVKAACAVHLGGQGIRGAGRTARIVSDPGVAEAAARSHPICG
eukprot:3441290-Alexandrium_andersonii.AAC.1